MPRRRRHHFGRHPLLDLLAGRGGADPGLHEGAGVLMQVARESAGASLARLESHDDGLSPHEAAARLARHGPNTVGHEAPLPVSPVLLGHQVEGMNDVDLARAVAAHQLFAKLTPLHKERIVQTLRQQGHVVGFMGDGMNDAPALRAADVGISVDSGVDIAKEAADVILLEKSLTVLDDGVLEGRITFCNMLKYIRMTTSSNFGNVLSVLVASAFLPFLPMQPLQLVLQNLLYDVSQIGIPFDHVDAELVNQPLQWKPSDVGRFMVFFGPVSSVFDLCMFAVMWWVFGADTWAEQGLFQSAWFVEALLTQTLIVHMIRTPKLPLFQSRASGALTMMTLTTMAVAVWLPMGPWAADFKLQPLPMSLWAWMVGLLLGYCALVTVMKRFYMRWFGWL